MQLSAASHPSARKPVRRYQPLVALIGLSLFLLLPASRAQAAIRTVNTTADNQSNGCTTETQGCTLREAITAAGANDTINFAPAVTGTITLTNGEIVIDKNLTINGPGARSLAISANLASRIFDIGGPDEVNVTVRISGLSLTNGNAGSHRGWNANVKLGGAIYNSGTLTLINCNVRGNQSGDANAADGFGGGIFNNVIATLHLVNCTFAYNLAQGQRPEGGAIWNMGTVNMTNCTLSNNQMVIFAHPQGFANSGAGAGIYNVRLGVNGVWSAATVNAVNCTIANNYFHLTSNANDTGHGGGIYKTHDATVNLRNTIIARNRVTASGTGPDVRSSTAFTSQGHNLIGITDGSVSTSWVSSDRTGNLSGGGLDPKLANPDGLGSPQNNGGPTDTHALLPTSPALGGGDDAVLAAPFNLTTDQRGSGYPRRIGLHVDIGAFEFDPPQSSTTLTVTTIAEHDDGTCGAADCTLLEALNAANANANANIINFRAGLTGTILNTVAPVGLAITNPVTINGPGARFLAISGNNASRVFNVSAGTVVISALTIKNGYVEGAIEDPFISLAGDGNGGGIAIASGSTVTLNACTIRDNSAYGGAGILGGGGFARGGGIYNLGALTLNNCTLHNNSANGGAGGFSNATGGGCSGGGIENAGTLSLTNCTLSNNSASGGRGGDDFNGTEPGTGGHASGGGIYSVVAQNLTLTNCTVSGNTASGGSGGIGEDFSQADPGNGDGGGVLHSDAAAKAHVGNTLIAGNSATIRPDVGGVYTSNGHNLIGNSAGSSGFTNNVNGDKVGITAVQLKLGPLQNNGGPTDTRALLPGSPAINAGNNALGPPTDQRGVARYGVRDIGAFEFQPQPPVNLSLAPANSSRVVGISNTYTSKYSDADGIPDIAEARILINSSLNGANGLHALYLLGSNRLYLRDNANSTWLGGFAPLSNNVITNSQGSLNCALTTVGGNGNTLTINWNFTPASTFTGGKYIYMQVRDKANLVDGWEQMGTVQMVANSAPINQSVTPNSGSSPAGIARTLTAKYFDTNGSTDIAEARILVNTAASGANALMGMYTPANNKLFLRDNANGSWLGGFAPGSANVITNSQGSLNCAETSVTFGAQILTINWSFKPLARFAGAKNIYLLARDRSNAVDGLEPLGTWTITNTALSSGERAAAGAPSPVVLSTAMAHVSSQSVLLTFTGALNAAVAEDAARYEVQINGVAVESATYNVASNSVTLSLSADALRVGDRVVVCWTELRDKNGATLSGCSGVVTAH